MILYLATGNAHKALEFAELFRAGARGNGCEVRSAAELGGMPEVEETGARFVDNALLKARALLARVPEGSGVLADDSGLEVDALGGRPGVTSARFAGPEADSAANNRKLLEALAGVPEDRRGARFVCVLALLIPGQAERVYEGTCAGRILFEPSGVKGFGYDPLFVPDGYDRSFADLGESIKHRISHRARAAEALLADVAG